MIKINYNYIKYNVRTLGISSRKCSNTFEYFSWQRSSWTCSCTASHLRSGTPVLTENAVCALCRKKMNCRGKSKWGPGDLKMQSMLQVWRTFKLKKVVYFFSWDPLKCHNMSFVIILNHAWYWRTTGSGELLSCYRQPSSVLSPSSSRIPASAMSASSSPCCLSSDTFSHSSNRLACTNERFPGFLCTLNVCRVREMKFATTRMIQ